MSRPVWVDFFDAEVGDYFFLAEILNTNTGISRLTLYDRPCRTNKSHEPRLTGWCGATNKASITARGVVRIVGTNKAGDRAQIAAVRGVDLDSFLRSEGYPELE